MLWFVLFFIFVGVFVLSISLAIIIKTIVFIAETFLLIKEFWDGRGSRYPVDKSY